jgi:outer membrane receptor protein involved in Fe transport
MKKIFTLVTTALLMVTASVAQMKGKISGSIIKNEKPAEGVTISILNANDSATVKSMATDKKGNFLFETLSYGKYILTATSVGYQKRISKPIEISAQRQAVQLPPLQLISVSKSMNEVTVTTKRPPIEQRIDRTIVNVDASVTNLGTSALEVLEKSPGVTVDRDGNISLKGKEGVLILVDGKPTHLGGADLANMLRNMSSNQLDQVEIMTNPPAKYDASGTSGLINIKTKKIITAGYNGSASVAFTYGRYPKTNEGLSFNFRENKINVFTNLSHNYRKSFGELKIQRKLFNPGTGEIENYFDQHADMINEGNSLNAKIGLDFFASKKTTIGVILNGATNPSSSGNTNVNDISNSSKVLENLTRAKVDNAAKWENFSTNLNFRTLLDKKGKELTSDIDILSYRSGTRQLMTNSYTDAAGNPSMKTDTLTGNLPQQIHVYSGRIDYLQPINKNSKFEAGIKTSLVRTDNNAIYDSIQDGITVHDFNRSNRFIYEENINAAYLNLSTSFSKKWSAQFGLRAENTNANGKQLTTGVKFTRHYTQLFPTAFFQYKWDDKNVFSANFGRRVRRPGYASLNPFIRFIDRYTYTQGNPNLKPSLSNNFEVAHNWKNQVTTTINYTFTTDIIEEVIDQKGQEAYKAPANIASLRQYGIAVNANTPITKWWMSSINVNVFNNRYQGIASGTQVEFSTISFIVTGTQQFKLSEKTMVEINGRIRNGWLEGITRAKAIAFVGAGLSQQVMKGKGLLRFTVRDIFYSQRFRGVSKYGNVDFNFQQTAESRVVSFGLTYRFSKGKKITPTKRTVGSANEEQERIGQ